MVAGVVECDLFQPEPNWQIQQADTDLSTEAVLPLAFALCVALVGVWLVRLARRRSAEELARAPESVAVKPHDGQSGDISLRRNGTVRADRRRAYRICVDDREVGYIRAGETIRFQVRPGERTISLRIDWARSNRLAVHLQPGEHRQLYCEPRATRWAAAFWMTLGRNRYIRLAEEQRPDPGTAGTAVSA